MRVAIMGAGGTGGYFGGLLARAGEDVTFIARGAHLEAIRANGLTVHSHRDGDFNLGVKCTDDLSDIGQLDLILFCVQTYDTDAAAQQIRPLVRPDTMILSVQNGIDSEKRIAQILGAEAVIGAAAYLSSVIESPGVISHTVGGRLVFGELSGGTSPRTEQLLEAFESAGISAELHPSIQVALWEKLVLISGLSGVTALTRLPVGPILDCPETSALYRGALEEVETVARASGINLPEGIVDRSIVSAPSERGFMYYDLVAGRRLELEALNGTVVRLGHKFGVPVPINSVIYAALKPYAEGTPLLP